MNNIAFPYKMVVVDSDTNALEMAAGVFGQEYDVECFTTTKSAMVYLNSLGEHDPPNIVLVSVDMRDDKGSESGFEFAKYLKETPLFSKVPLIFQSNNYDVEMQERCFRLGASDFIFKPYNKVVANARVSNAIKVSLYQRRLESDIEYKQQKIQEKRDKLLQNATQIVNALVSTIETNHIYTKGHSNRVAEFGVLLAKKIGYPSHKLGFLKQAGLLHDIGKIGIANRILNKTGHLSNDEYCEIKVHTSLGCEILSSLEDFKIERDVALHHHERWDGKGYPCNLQGEEISLEARIIAVADAYDVMKYGRLYQTSKSNEEIVNELEKNAGLQFDPHLARVFASMVRSGEVDKFINSNKIEF